MRGREEGKGKTGLRREGWETLGTLVVRAWRKGGREDLGSLKKQWGRKEGTSRLFQKAPENQEEGRFFRRSLPAP